MTLPYAIGPQGPNFPKFSGRQGLVSGPWRGVLDTADPLDDAPDRLVNAQNGYFIDPSSPNGFYQRPGFRFYPGLTCNPGAMSALYEFAVADGTAIRFCAMGGKLYRMDVSSGGIFPYSFTDVTPAGITITAADGIPPVATTRYYMTQIAGQLVFSDGVNTPWLGTNLSATPITGTKILANSGAAGGTWAAQGAPFLYQGSLGFLVKTAPATGSNVQSGLGFIWCEPNQPAVGYEQTSYANFFNYIQAGSAPLYAAVGTNEGIYLFRERDIAQVVGALTTLATNPTTATVAVNVGTMAPAAIRAFGSNLFFVDRLGRPYMLQLGAPEPIPLWEQMRGQFTRTPAYLNYPTATAYVAVSELWPEGNVWLVAPFSSGPTGGGGNQAPLGPNVAFAFDARTGTYLGSWTIGAASVTWDSLAVMRDANNNPRVIIGNVGTGLNFTLWYGSLLSAAQWYDVELGGAQTVFPRTIQTGRLGYAADQTWNADRAVAVTMTSDPCQISVVTPYDNATVEGTPSPASSVDGTYRLVCGLGVRAARGIEVTVQPTTATAQWGCQRVEVQAVPSRARPEDA